MDHQCKRCNYEWKPRKNNSKYCPKCNSPYWNKTRKQTTKQEVERMNKLILTCYSNIIDTTKEKNQGIRDPGGIHNCSYRIVSYEKSNPKDISGITITIIIEIAKKGHFFVDGNKRTAFAVAKAYLLEKGYILEILEIKAADSFIRDLTKYESKITLKKAKNWIKKYIKKNRKTLESHIIDQIIKNQKNGRSYI
jgi:death-on-curing family protein